MDDPELSRALAEVASRLEAIEKKLASALKNPLMEFVKDLDLPKLLAQSQSDSELVRAGLAAVQKNLVIIAAKVDRVTATLNEERGKVA